MKGILELVLDALPKWRAFRGGTYKTGISQARAFMNLPYDVIPGVSPSITSWSQIGPGNSFVLAPSEDAMTDEMWSRGLNPITVKIGLVSGAEHEELDYIMSSYSDLGRSVDSNGEPVARIKAAIMRFEDEVIGNVIFIFDKQDVVYSFSFEIPPHEDEEDHLIFVTNLMDAPAQRVSKYSYFKTITARNKSKQAAADLIFSLSVTGEFIKKGDKPFAPLYGLDESAWEIYFHNGPQTISTIFKEANCLNHPSEIANSNTARLYRLSESIDGKRIFGLDDNGAQFFMVPPIDAIDTMGCSPLLVSILCDADRTIEFSDQGFDTLLESPDSSTVAIRERIQHPDYGYIMKYTAVSVTHRIAVEGMYIPSGESKSKTYDHAFIALVYNIETNLFPTSSQ